MSGKNQAALFAIPERRNVHRDFGDAVVEVFAEHSLRNQILRILIGRTNHANVDGNLLASADALDDSLLQEAKQLRLQCHRHVADLVEEQCAAVGDFDLADRLFVCTREGTFLVAEQLGLEQILGDRSAVYRDEVALSPRAQSMQCAREQLLASAAFSQQQRGDIRRRNLLDHAANGEHTVAGSDNAVKRRAADLVLQFAVLGLELGDVECAIDEQSQRIGVDRFLVEIVGALRYSRERVFLVAVAGHNDNLRVRCEFQRLGKGREPLFDALGLRRQAQVLQHHGGLVPSQLGNRRFAILGREHVVALEAPFELAQEARIVFDNE